MLLNYISEIILYVQDMAGQVAFYRNALGLTITWPAGLTDYSGEHWVTFATGDCTLALHSGGQAPSGSPPRFGFSVTDIEAARSTLLAAGVELSEVRSPAPEVAVCDAKDPEGNGFFIEQRQQDRR